MTEDGTSKSRTEQAGMAVNDNGEVEVSVRNRTVVLSPEMAEEWASKLEHLAIVAKGVDQDG